MPPAASPAETFPSPPIYPEEPARPLPPAPGLPGSPVEVPLFLGTADLPTPPDFAEDVPTRHLYTVEDEPVLGETTEDPESEDKPEALLDSDVSLDGESDAEKASKGGSPGERISCTKCPNTIRAKDLDVPNKEWQCPHCRDNTKHDDEPAEKPSLFTEATSETATQSPAEAPKVVSLLERIADRRDQQRQKMGEIAIAA